MNFDIDITTLKAHKIKWYIRVYRFFFKKKWKITQDQKIPVYIGESAWLSIDNLKNN